MFFAPKYIKAPFFLNESQTRGRGYTPRGVLLRKKFEYHRLFCVAVRARLTDSVSLDCLCTSSKFVAVPPQASHKIKIGPISSTGPRA